MLLTPGAVAYCFSQLPDYIPQLQVRKALEMPLGELYITMWILHLHGFCEKPRAYYPVRFFLPHGLVLEHGSLHLDLVDRPAINSRFRISGKCVDTVRGEELETHFEELERLTIVYKKP